MTVVPDRLSAVDASFLYLEEPTTAMHTGSLMVFQALADGPSETRTYQRMLSHVASRIAFAPRYRQRVRTVPWRLANPVWVDDERFQITHHVRRSVLPRPGDEQQLRELVARVQARPLDRARPLWELYVVEGLQGGRFALITKVHTALVDGVHALDLAEVVLDDTPEGGDPPPDTWRPQPEPSVIELVTSAVVDGVRRPQQVVETLRATLRDVQAGASRTTHALAGLASAARTATRTAARPAPGSPLNRAISPHRRFATVATRLADYRAVRDHHSRARSRVWQSDNGTTRLPAPLTVNDVVLATVSGALRAWLLTRGSPVTPSTTVRALVPVSLRADPGAASGSAHPSGRIDAQLVDLPVGEPNPVLRLHQVAYQMRGHSETGRAVGARALADLAGFAPPTLHSLGARLASGLSRRLFNLLVTNVPGPQHQLYAAGSRLQETYPVVPLARGQALAIGVTSYDGGVFYGLNADRDAMPDADVLAGCLAEALAELQDSVR